MPRIEKRRNVIAASAMGTPTWTKVQRLLVFYSWLKVESKHPARVGYLSGGTGGGVPSLSPFRPAPGLSVCYKKRGFAALRYGWIQDAGSTHPEHS